MDGREVGLGPGNIVLDGDPAPLPKKGAQQPPTFQPICCGQTAAWIKMSLGMEVGLNPRHIVLHGDPAPPKRGKTALQFSTHVCCGQFAGWIKMPLVMDVGLGPGHIVLDGDPAAPFKGAQPPIFSP